MKLLLVTATIIWTLLAGNAFGAVQWVVRNGRVVDNKQRSETRQAAVPSNSWHRRVPYSETRQFTSAQSAPVPSGGFSEAQFRASNHANAVQQRIDQNLAAQSEALNRALDTGRPVPPRLHQPTLKTTIIVRSADSVQTFKVRVPQY